MSLAMPTMARAGRRGGEEEEEEEGEGRERFRRWRRGAVVAEQWVGDG